jgi:hypothetical protein
MSDDVSVQSHPSLFNRILAQLDSLPLKKLWLTQDMWTCGWVLLDRNALEKLSLAQKIWLREWVVFQGNGLNWMCTRPVNISSPSSSEEDVQSK